MELEDISLDLHALINLYGLLRSNSDGLMSPTPVNLDEKAKLQLKNLLDLAAERVFENHLKIIAAQSKISNKPGCISSNEPAITMKLQTIDSQDVSISSSIITKPHSKNSDNNETELPKNDRLTEKQIPEENVPTLSDSRKKLCRFCQQNSIKNPNISTRKDFGVKVENTETPGQKRICKIKTGPNSITSLASSSSTQLGKATKPFTEHNLANEINKTLEAVDNISEEVNEATKRIKTGLKDLRTLAETVDLLKELKETTKTSSISTVLPCQQFIKNLKDLSPTNNGLSHIEKGTSVPSGLQNRAMSRKEDVLKPTIEGHDHAKKAKAIVEKIESLKSENGDIQNQGLKFVRGLRTNMQIRATKFNHSDSLPSVKKCEALKPHDKMDETRAIGFNRKNNRPTLLERQSSISTVQPTGYRMDQSLAIVGLNRKNMPHQVAVMRPTLLDRQSSISTVQPTKTSGAHKKIDAESQCRASPRQQISSEESESNFNSSSSWTSKQTSTSCTESETGSEGYASLRTKRSPLLRPGSRRIGSDSSYSTAMEESSDSSYGKRSNYRSFKGGFSRQNPIKNNSEKRIGRFRRLKNKLGLVFHHHHHHHHHHRKDGDDHAMSLWTHVKNSFHQSKKNNVHDDHDDDDSVMVSRRKSVISNTKNKNQHGHFHDLVEGLMSHVKRSRKSQPSKEGIGRLEINGRNKKVMKKLHWWQILKRKKGVKTSNKGRVKLGYGGKKTQLRGGKMR